ncbi:hypothetical protein C2869_14090 [Saccharobesus litoralis]|uniref:Killing trait domain-containing protein n=1 Tax=Saccharobesus litoralis TaxID=2172099 RepID=A0A2S0VTG2_9ALTE|nr:RebB family R body protein [Saccharobesus litoralis]AWB67499.1 hypothetical protein C2869_14090 [Saccharobesus litoralis]
MSNDESNSTSQERTITTAGNVPFSPQSTGLVETTFAETLGLSMHNAIVNQQSSQMTTAASVTNACARLLQAQVPIQEVKKDQGKVIDAEPVVADPADKPEEKPKRKFNPFAFMKKKKQPDDAEAEVSAAQDN